MAAAGALAVAGKEPAKDVLSQLVRGECLHCGAKPKLGTRMQSLTTLTFGESVSKTC